MRFVTRKDLKFRQHKRDSHKGDNGRVLIVGGSKEYVGAVALAGIAALRSGCDTVTIAAPEKVAWAINCLSPDLMTIKLEGEYLHRKHVKKINALMQKSDVLLIGNGLGLNDQTGKAIKKIVKSANTSANIPLVVDADAIKSLSINDINNAIITPHKKEFEILCENSKITPGVKEIQPMLRSNVLVIKGRIDAIVSKALVMYNKTGNEAMTKGGTGDVLAGICAGLVAQKYGLFEASCIAAYLNGAIGDLEKKKRGYSFIASDMLNDIKRILG